MSDACTMGASSPKLRAGCTPAGWRCSSSRYTSGLFQSSRRKSKTNVSNDAVLGEWRHHAGTEREPYYVVALIKARTGSTLLTETFRVETFVNADVIAHPTCPSSPIAPPWWGAGHGSGSSRIRGRTSSADHTDDCHRPDDPERSPATA